MARPAIFNTKFRWDPIYTNPIFPPPPPPPVDPSVVWVYSSDFTHWRLQSINVSNPAAPALLTDTLLTGYETLATSDATGFPKHLIVDQNYIYYTYYNHLIVRNNNSSNPSLLTDYTNSGVGTWRYPIRYKTSTLLIIEGQGVYAKPMGVARVNISNPAVPFISSAINTSTPSWGWDVAQRGGDGAVSQYTGWGSPNSFVTSVESFANAEAATMAIDADPLPDWSHPAYTTGGFWGPITFYDKYMYVYGENDGGNGRLAWYDNTLALGGSVVLPSANNPPSHRLMIHGTNLIAFTTGSSPTADISIWSLANPNSPSQIASIVLPFATSLDAGICVSKNYIFFCSYNAGPNDSWIFIYDISNPASPVFVNSPGTKFVLNQPYGPIAAGCYPITSDGGNIIVS